MRVPYGPAAVLEESYLNDLSLEFLGRQDMMMMPESEYLPVYNAHKNLSGPERVHNPATCFAVCLLYPVGAAFFSCAEDPQEELTPGRRNARAFKQRPDWG